MMNKSIPPIAVHLTDRDRLILRDLHCFGFLTFRQLKEKYFEHRSKGTLSNRLSRLKFAGFISSHPIGTLPGGGTERVVGTIFRLTRRGVLVLRSALPGEWIDDPQPITIATLHHDACLNSLLLWCERENPEVEILASTALRRKNGGSRNQVPDAVILDKRKGLRIAVELELTQKSESRYREIVLNYQLSKDYDHVLYVVGNAAIESKLKQVILGGGNTSDLGPDSFRPFSFVSFEKIHAARKFSPIAIVASVVTNIIPIHSRREKMEAEEGVV